MPVRDASRSRSRLAGLVVALALVITSCSSSSGPLDVARSKPAAVTGTRPQPSARVAVEKLLAAEQRGDHAASFALVLRGPDEPYRELSQWVRRRRELPAITGFSVTGRGDAHAVATVEHHPGLDPFVGLSPARERQTWTARRAGGGWLLRPDPETRAILPPDARAGEAVRAWARDVQRCDQAAAATRQAVTVLFGSVSRNVQLCHASGEVVVGRAGRLTAGPLSGDIVAQYSADALTWARVVPVTAPVQLVVVVAPIGDDWKILGIGDAS